jgi:hypothetical protein
MFKVTGDQVEYAVQVLSGPTTHDTCAATSDGTRTICDAVFDLIKNACENSLDWFHDGMNEQRFGVSERGKAKA